MPYATFSGIFLHSDLYEIAAAYAFHICRNHPFVDDNKRAALVSALIFLELSGTGYPGRDNPKIVFYYGAYIGDI